jgi:signal transduction histidine kinase
MSEPDASCDDSVPLATTNEAYWHQAQQILEVLSALNYRTGQLSQYLTQIACGVSSLIGLDWSIITICKDGQERLIASSLPILEEEEGEAYSLHGTLTEIVVNTGTTLTMDDISAHPEIEDPPEGYQAYLGIPMITSTGDILGTICSFSINPRRFTSAEVRTVELFAERAATAIENYRLFQQLQHLNQNLEAEVIQRTEELRIAQSRLIEKERLAAIGEFAAMIVHEIRNPVTTILMGLTAIQPELQGERNQRRVALALEETERLHNLVKEILLHSKPQVLEKSQYDLNQLLESMLERLRDIPDATERNLVFVPAAEPLPIMVDKDKLKQVMINLVRNAYEAITPGETVTCTVFRDTPGYACIQVHNGGDPIPSDVLPLLNQPFCSTKTGGTGLGLAVIRRIVIAHGGSFTIESSPNIGTIATIRLPI